MNAADETQSCNRSMLIIEFFFPVHHESKHQLYRSKIFTPE